MTTATAPTPDTHSLARDAIKSVTALATLPEVTARIIATVENPRSSAANLHKIITHDPALVTRILKLVNSAFYGLPGQVGSIDRAIVLLGLNAVKNIAIAASLGQLFRGVRLCDKFSARDLWTHCIAVAVAGRELAKGLKLHLVDEAFLGGMIHDAGILVCASGLAGKDPGDLQRRRRLGRRFLPGGAQCAGGGPSERWAKRWPSNGSSPPAAD